MKVLTYLALLPNRLVNGYRATAQLALRELADIPHRDLPRVEIFAMIHGAVIGVALLAAYAVFHNILKG